MRNGVHVSGILSGATGFLCLLLFVLVGMAPVPAAESSEVVASESVRILEFSGRVDVVRRGTNPWEPARLSQVLSPGDRLRTGAESRATLQFSDRSIFRVNQSSVVEISPSDPATRRRSLFLRLGELFFFDRERPQSIEIRTPTTTSAIRGTEFVLGVEEPGGIARLTMLDGVVLLSSTGDPVEVVSHQEAVVRPGAAPEIRPLLEARLAIQWCLHYPGVIVPEDLVLSVAEASALSGAIAAYRSGDLLAALRLLPDDAGLTGMDARCFAAALRLAVGQVKAAERVVKESGMTGAAPGALRRLLAAVRGDEWGAMPKPETASEWLAESYLRQSRSDLRGALAAAVSARALAPQSGFVHVREAELEWSLGHRRDALEALALGRERSPRNPMGFVVAGFIELGSGRVTAARDWFERARAVDGSVADAWLGLGLVAERNGDRTGALEFLQAAAALEPGRAVLRSYLGKGFAVAGDGRLALREFGLAIDLDPNDPTGWLYRGLENQQTHRLNESVDDLRASISRNDNRSVFRSSLQLDQDRSVRQADLSVSYAAAGLGEVAERTASRAIGEDYADFAAHLFRARTLQQEHEDPTGFETRFESARQSHLLVANLLAPPEGANLSQQLSQQDHLRPFDGGRFHGMSETGYRSSGAWSESVSLFGTEGRLAYALDGQYQAATGDGPNSDRQNSLVSVQAKQGVGVADEAYLQAGWLRRDGGDISRLYDPSTSVRGYHFEESEAPFAYLGWHHEWAPGSHTLALGSYVDDDMRVLNPEPEVLFLRQSGGKPLGLGLDPFFDSGVRSRFQLASIEAQQIWGSEKHEWVVGARYQHGEFNASETLDRLVDGRLATPDIGPGYEDAAGYAYYTFKPWKPLHLTAGVAYDDMTFPANPGWPPLGAGERHRAEWSPKFGATWVPWKDGQLRMAYARSLGGQDFAQSLRIEPVEVAGFTQAYRNLAPAAASGILTGLPQDVVGVGFDQAFASRTFVGVFAERRTTWGERDLGVVQNATLLPVPDTIGQIAQRLDYREETLSVYADQLLGNRWATGVRYSLSRADLLTGFPGLPAGLPGASELSSDVASTLGQLQLWLAFNHESGFFARWASSFHHQQGSGASSAWPDESFWQQDVWVGYRFPRRRAEVRVGILDLTGEDYRLNPINDFRPLPRERTFEASLRFHF